MTTVAAEGAAIVMLTAIGREPAFRVPLTRLDDWLAVTPPADALVAGLRWVALLGAWWLLAGTLVYVAAAVTRVPAAVRAVRWAALPPVRRVVDAAFAATVVGGAVLAPATAGARVAGPPPTTFVRDGRGGDLASLPPATTAAPNPPAVPPTVRTAPTAPTRAAPRAAPRRPPAAPRTATGRHGGAGGRGAGRRPLGAGRGPARGNPWDRTGRCRRRRDRAVLGGGVRTRTGLRSRRAIRT